jgi:hypothetical protein
MSYESYVIPPNFTDAGRVLGMFETRNLIEAVVLTVPIAYFSLALLPFSLTTKLIVTISLAVPIGGFGLIGIGGDSLSRWLKSWWIWRKQRRYIFYRGEVDKN